MKPPVWSALIVLTADILFGSIVGTKAFTRLPGAGGRLWGGCTPSKEGLMQDSSPVTA